MISIYLILLFFLCGKGTAQVSVDKDPFHKVILENEYLRLLDGRVPALDTTLMHIHSANSVVVFLAKSTFGIQNIGEKPAIAKVNPGDVVYRAYGDKPVNHKVWDQSNSLFHFWVVELVKHQLNGDTCTTLSLPHLEVQWQKKLVRAYKLKLGKGESINLPKSNCAYLAMNFSGTTSISLREGVRSLRSDDFLFISPRSDAKFSNSDKKLTECVLLELK